MPGLGPLLLSPLLLSNGSESLEFSPSPQSVTPAETSPPRRPSRFPSQTQQLHPHCVGLQASAQRGPTSRRPPPAPLGPSAQSPWPVSTSPQVLHHALNGAHLPSPGQSPVTLALSQLSPIPSFSVAPTDSAGFRRHTHTCPARAVPQGEARVPPSCTASPINGPAVPTRGLCTCGPLPRMLFPASSVLLTVIQPSLPEHSAGCDLPKPCSVFLTLSWPGDCPIPARPPPWCCHDFRIPVCPGLSPGPTYEVSAALILLTLPLQAPVPPPEGPPHPHSPLLPGSAGSSWATTLPRGSPGVQPEPKYSVWHSQGHSAQKERA